MSEPVRCDGCGATGVRSLDRMCPHNWYYLKAEDEGGEGTFYVFACSPQCKRDLWQRGPGPSTGERLAYVTGPYRAERPREPSRRCWQQADNCKAADCPEHGIFPRGDG